MRRRSLWAGCALGMTALLAACPGDGPKPPVGFNIVQGSGQSGVAGAAVQVTPTIKVVDEDGNGVGGATFHFSVLTGGGSVTTSTGTVGADGLATPGSWILGTKAGPNALGASVDGIGTPVTFTATGTAGPAAKLVVATQPGNAPACGGVATQPVISILDANDNLTSSTAAVTASIASGAGTLSGTTTVNAVAGTATFTNLVVTGSGAVTLSFTASGVSSATSNSFTPATATVAGPFNLAIDGMYLTQSTQDYAGNVPLIANRAALLRVFVKATAANTTTPAVKVTTYQAGTLLKTYTITSPSQSAPTCVDEGNLTASWNVSIPASEVVANMSVLAEVDPTNVVTESSDSDNKFPASGTPKTLDVRTTAPMRITFIPVTQGGGTGDISASNVNAYLDYPLRVYPWVPSTMDIQYHAPYAYGTTLNGASYDAGWTTLLNEIDAMRVNEQGSGGNRYYYAVVKPSYNSGGTGFGRIGGAAAIGVDIKFNGTVQPSTNYYSMTLAHELGHNFGRNHVNCGNPSNPDINYPYSPTSSIGVYGWDPSTNVLRGKDSYTDFMSYCSPLWISDYTYKAVIAWRETHFEPPPASPRRSLLVWGRIGPTGVVLEPAFEIDAPPALPERAGRYSVQAVDGAGQEVFNLSFDGAEVDHAPGERNFAWAVPLPSTGQVSELRLRDGQTVMTRRSRTTLTNAPATGALASVRLRSLSTARSRLEWDASTYPVAMVRDPASGEVLGFLRGGSGDLGSRHASVDVLFSNGVSSVRQRVQITR